MFVCNLSLSTLSTPEKLYLGTDYYPFCLRPPHEPEIFRVFTNNLFVLG